MENIKTRQNEPWMLRIQYGARYHFNRAEIIGYWIWVAALLAELCIFLPDCTPSVLNWGLPFFFLAAEAVLSAIFEKHIQRGSSLRNFFDSYVLNLNYDNHNSYQIQKIEEEAQRVFDKNTAVANIQIKIPETIHLQA